MGWTDGPLIGFDTETTGVDVTSDRIVTAALVHRDPAGGTVARTWLLDPGVEIPAEAAAIHGITTEHARAHGRPPADALDEIAAELATAAARGVPVVAYNAAFDLTLLDAELVRHGLRTLPERLGHPVRPVVDPLVLDRALDRYRKGKRRLGDLCEHYGVQAGAEGLHTADVDVVATLDVLAAIVAVHDDVTALDLAALHSFQIDAHETWARSFNAWREREGLPGPGASLEWPTTSRETVTLGR
ncbi:DNA polymerase-3 subunit epsilon [Sediminihabitans luteus]|uniref:DNA polymerase-3 subunit epsilon n=1 Tax=Sediminihabitans luteus TaxID=1138585 RepID=A0A2M9CZ46_9CELL|nr:exonuclease domain-containing protein [Sediminihabitans luteus]PJJ77199.1 DNA polymerase-3 subunit epsilon [Sediminihabitans luteus]GII98647.1 DNA polymerase III subunit epsilon [Sediminihabitans luteus]